MSYTGPEAALKRDELPYNKLPLVPLGRAFGLLSGITVIDLTTSVAGPYATMLLPDCRRWSRQAVLALGDATRGGREEMQLQAALGLSSMLTDGNSDMAFVALNRSLAIAEAHGDALNQLQLLGLLHTFHYRRGDFRTALMHAERSMEVSRALANPGATAFARSLLGISLHLSDIRHARSELEAALMHGPASPPTGSVHLGYDYSVWTGVALARTLWLQGHPDQAAERIRQIVRDAVDMNQPVTLSIALARAVSVFLWTGDLRGAEEYVDWAISHAESHALAPYLAAARGYKGELAIRRGDASGGVDILQDCLKELHATNYELLSTPFTISLAQGLATIGRVTEAIIRIDETIRLVQVNGDVSYLPELLRVKGNILLMGPSANETEAETLLAQSLEMSRRMAALGWELRAAIDLATLWSGQGRSEAARMLLRPVFEQFMEGLDTADLKAAERLLATLG